MKNLTGQTITQLIESKDEMDVNSSYRQFISTKIPDIIFTSPFKCDGFGVSQKYGIRLLCEFKKDVDLRNKSDQVDVLIQTIYYVKKFELNGIILPNVLLLADRNEWFLIHTNKIFEYLSLDINWELAASSAYKQTELHSMLMENDKITPFVYSIDEIDSVIEKMKDLAKNITRLISITPHNITEVFSYFEKNVLGKHNLTTNQLANLFVQLLINPDENYLHPVTKRKTIVTKTFNEVSIKSKEAFTSFFSHFASTYTPSQKEELTAVVDRLVQDITRRKQGEFFTPTMWANKGHEYISMDLGSDWKDEYVVWDSCWGTGNLTRGYKFKELYASTLIYEDIQTANQMGYNPEATKFQFDFLNDDYDFLPQKLRNVIESQRKMLILINPPYIKSTPILGNVSTGVSETLIGGEMNDKKMGIASSQLSTQFLFRIMKLKEKNPNIKIAIFNKPNYMTSDGFKTLRTDFLNNFGFMGGFLFNSGHFSDTSDSWGITFSLWDSQTNQIKNNFKHKVLDLNKNYEIIELGEKTLYNCDNQLKANTIFKEKIEVNNILLPPIKSYLTLDYTKTKLGNSNSLGYINNHSNNLMQQNVIFLASSVISANGNKSINKNNFLKVLSLFGARKIVSQNWINDKDEYLAPNENNENYQQFTNDSVVYSLFNNSSQQSSLRQITYKDKLWDIKNEFFWLSKQKMMDLADTNHYTELYVDARTSDNRYVYNLLFGEQDIYNKLSPDAKLVLDKATELVKKSMRQRQLMADDTNHLNSWDAGYAQLKLVWKEHFPEEFKQFRQLYKNLEDRMRPLVYELGFLLK